jgi:hypothetical protein
LRHRAIRALTPVFAGYENDGSINRSVLMMISILRRSRAGAAAGCGRRETDQTLLNPARILLES